MLTISVPPARRRLIGVTFVTLILILLISVYALRNSTVTKKNRAHVIYQRPVITRDDTLKDLDSGLQQYHDEHEQHMSDHTHSLTRLGSQLKFNLSTCPAGSKMLIKDWQDVIVPRTSLCPQLFIIGAKKGGTTSLYNYLSHHPDFEGIRLNVSTMIGETAYFANNYKTVPLKRYLSMFPRDKMSGDASVDNLPHCYSPQRILKTCGGDMPKIIVLLRDPIDRYVSNFMMRVTRKEYGKYNSFTTIQDTTEHELEVLRTAVLKKGFSFSSEPASSWSKLRCIFGCCDSMIYEGLYYVFLMNWLCNFPAENIMIVNSEEFFQNPTLILKQAIEFLELSPLRKDQLEQITSQVYNKGTSPLEPHHQLTSSHKQQLNEIYEHYNVALLKLLRWQDTVSW